MGASGRAAYTRPGVATIHHRPKGPHIMAHPTIATVELFRIERLRSSANGNPRYRLHTDQGRYDTQSDGQIGYKMGNLHDRQRRLADYHYTLYLTEAGRVWDMTMGHYVFEVGQLVYLGRGRTHWQVRHVDTDADLVRITSTGRNPQTTTVRTDRVTPVCRSVGPGTVVD